MFINQNKRFMTKAIGETIPLEIQLLLWNLIDLQRKIGNELDLNLEIKTVNKRILHRQEIPPSKSRWISTLKSTNPLDCVVWCIDDGENQMIVVPK